MRKNVESRDLRSFSKRILIIFGVVGLLIGCTTNPPEPANSPVANSPVLPNPSPSPSPSPSSSASPSPTSLSPASPEATPTPSPDNSKVIQEIETRLSEGVSETTGVPVQSVNCPDVVNVKVGSRFDCEATSGEQKFAIATEITNETGPQYRWNTKGLLIISKLERFIQQQIKNTGNIDVTADCGSSKIRVAVPGETFSCQITDSKSQSRSVNVAVKDEQGNVDVSFQK